MAIVPTVFNDQQSTLKIPVDFFAHLQNSHSDLKNSWKFKEHSQNNPKRTKKSKESYYNQKTGYNKTDNNK